MNLSTFAARSAWMGWWDLMRKYHRYEVRGREKLLRQGPGIILGYHGRPGARALCMLQALLLAEHGEPTYAVTHDLVFRVPFIRRLAKGMELVSREPSEIEAVIKRGEKLVIAPGGVQEAWGSFRDRYHVKWGKRLGYLKLALKYNLPLIPVAAAGDDDAFYGLFDAYTFWKRLGFPDGVGACLCLGPCGFWPFTPPFPVRIVLYVGEAVDLSREQPPIDINDRDRLLEIHERMITTVQQLVDRAQAETRGRAHGDEFDNLTWVNQVTP